MTRPKFTLILTCCRAALMASEGIDFFSNEVALHDVPADAGNSTSAAAVAATPLGSARACRQVSRGLCHSHCKGKKPTA